MLSEKYKPTVSEYGQNDIIYQSPNEKEIKLHKTDQKLRIAKKKIQKEKERNRQRHWKCLMNMITSN